MEINLLSDSEKPRYDELAEKHGTVFSGLDCCFFLDCPAVKRIMKITLLFWGFLRRENAPAFTGFPL